MYYGADYYPEHWPEERWPVDAKLMKEAGINLIRVAEFAWAKIEPSEGVYDFAWLDKALDVFYKEGIQVVMCTPTPTPPKWLMDKYPSIYKRDENNLVLGFGSRRHYCYNSEIYREYSAKITEKIAKHYANHPAVAAWQVDNEYTCGDGLYCYCDECRDNFTHWLKHRYGSLDAVNEAWGTVFWSQTYTDWQQIIVPARTQASMELSSGHNPGLWLDYSRFQSDSIVGYNHIQCRIIRKYSAAPVTHNVVSELYDYYDIGEDLDIATYDNYPASPWGAWLGEAVYDPAFSMDIERGIKNKNFWVMEEQSGPCGWNALGSTPRPGQIRDWVYQALAHGAEAIVYFRWRACLFGTEQYWYGILDHDGVPRRRYEEIKQLGQDFGNIAKYNVGSSVASDIMMVRSFEQQWAHGQQQHNWGFNYRNYLRSLYAGFYQNNYNINITSERYDFSGYKLVLAPAFNLMDSTLQARFEAYVKNGGNLVVTFRSGTRDKDNKMSTKTLPGYFAEVAGIELEEFDSINNYKTAVKGVFGEGEASMWADIINPGSTAKVIATYSSEYYAGKAAITVNSYGKGKCYYIGCDLNEEGTAALLDYIARDCGLAPAMENMPAGIEVVKKQTADGQSFYFMMNFSKKTQQITLPFEVQNIATGQPLGKTVALAEYGCLVFKQM